MKCQLVLDGESNDLLNRLARPRGNNRSFVVRQALRVYAAIEEYLDELEKDPRFRRMMDASEDDIRAGRLHSQRAAERLVRRRRG
ncbi:MAG: hypothetical protein HYY26_03095 [Acidobacteria bacterium]|nr:hypothetical protein [Acidobacteriota bacterium]